LAGTACQLKMAVFIGFPRGIRVNAEAPGQPSARRLDG
jgi:hypothetical protein